jgi:phosphoserine phosphatase
VLLLSGTLQFLADGIAAQLGVADCIGSECATRGELFDWRPPLRHPFGTEKLALATDYCRRAGIAPSDVIAYGDSRHDLPLLYWCGHPVAVRPDAELARVARERHWELLGEQTAGARSDSLIRPG